MSGRETTPPPAAGRHRRPHDHPHRHSHCLVAHPLPPPPLPTTGRCKCGLTRRERARRTRGAPRNSGAPPTVCSLELDNPLYRLGPSVVIRYRGEDPASMRAASPAGAPPSGRPPRSAAPPRVVGAPHDRPFVWGARAGASPCPPSSVPRPTEGTKAKAALARCRAVPQGLAAPASMLARTLAAGFSRGRPRDAPARSLFFEPPIPALHRIGYQSRDRCAQRADQARRRGAAKKKNRRAPSADGACGGGGGVCVPAATHPRCRRRRRHGRASPCLGAAAAAPLCRPPSPPLPATPLRHPPPPICISGQYGLRPHPRGGGAPPPPERGRRRRRCRPAGVGAAAAARRNPTWAGRDGRGGQRGRRQWGTRAGRVGGRRWAEGGGGKGGGRNTRRQCRPAPGDTASGRRVAAVGVWGWGWAHGAGARVPLRGAPDHPGVGLVQEGAACGAGSCAPPLPHSPPWRSSSFPRSRPTRAVLWNAPPTALLPPHPPPIPLTPSLLSPPLHR